MPTLIPVLKAADIFPEYRHTPIERLLRHHNLGEPLPPANGHAEMLIGMCMDHRKDLRLPNEFAYVLRGAGGNLSDSEFEISYAIAVGGISALALLSHSDCGMTNLASKRETFIRGLMERGGWDEESASRQFAQYAARYEIGDPLHFVTTEAARLRLVYPGVMIVPLLYTVEDDLLVQIDEKS